MNRQQRAACGEETLRILEQGYYANTKEQQVSLQPALQEAVAQTVYYHYDGFAPLFAERDARLENLPLFETRYEVTPESTLQANERLVQAGERVFCLNFASAKNPGGGFLSGAQSQEESLARSSGLYACQMAQFGFYEANRQLTSALYTDDMLFSPDVPVFRDDEGALLDVPYSVSFLTSPAVNAGVVLEREPYSTALINDVMRQRLEKVLTVALVHGYSTLVLGAWGCGVFRNQPRDIAACFKHHLIDNSTFANRFKRVVFAIYSTNDMRNLEPFNEVFALIERSVS